MTDEKNKPKVTIVNTNKKFFGKNSKAVYFKRNKETKTKEEDSTKEE